MKGDIKASIIEKNLILHGIRFSKWSPGDGKTRYRITNMEGGREFSPNMDLSELRGWFRGFMFAKTGREY